MSKTGVLLVNTGTVAEPTTAATRSFLREFLMDRHILGMPWPIRWLLVNAVIIPGRAEKVARAYESIWTEDGSPLATISRQVREGLAERLNGPPVEIAMRYGQPSIETGLKKLVEAGSEDVLVLPLFPQFADATTGSIIDKTNEIARRVVGLERVSFAPAFFDAPGLINAWVALAKPVLESFNADHVLLSYHGLPVKHVHRADTSGRHCLAKPDCCATLTHINANCYRAQCFATSRAIIRGLGLEASGCATSFQSRLGKAEWIGPSTTAVLAKLARNGVKRLAVLCPAFVADCLETIEEIGIRARETFIAAGGEDLVLVPAPNAEPVWLDGLADIVRPLLLPP